MDSLAAHAYCKINYNVPYFNKISEHTISAHQKQAGSSDDSLDSLEILFLHLIF